ncbi:hypothetical protein BX616_005370, partial [Lobosporangium transversale]
SELESDSEPELENDSALFLPFGDLVKFIFDKADGRDVELPTNKVDHPSLDFEQLYNYAYGLLAGNSDPKGKKALVAVSGIVNTVQDTPAGVDLAKTVKKECLHPHLSTPIDELQELQLLLLESMGSDEDLPDLEALKVEWFALKRHTGSESGFGQDRIQDTDALKRHSGSFGQGHRSMTSTEPVEPVWKTGRSGIIMNEALFNIHGINQYIYMPANCIVALSTLRGELGCEASKDARVFVENFFGKTTKNIVGRKVDIHVKTKLDEWIEIAINEFKTNTATKATLEQQQRKSVRLNGSILRKLELKGVDISKSYPLILEGRGLQGYLYAMKGFDGLLGVGVASRKAMFIPSNAFQMRVFLQGNTLSTLFHYADHMRRYSIQVQQQLSSVAGEGFEAFLADSDDDVVVPPQGLVAPRIIFSPRKRKAELSLSDDGQE